MNPKLTPLPDAPRIIGAAIETSNEARCESETAHVALFDLATACSSLHESLMAASDAMLALQKRLKEKI